MFSLEISVLTFKTDSWIKYSTGFQSFMLSRVLLTNFIFYWRICFIQPEKTLTWFNQTDNCKGKKTKNHLRNKSMVIEN